MQQGICPFLGQKEDPETSLGFPSEGNFCHHARPVSSINSAHQEKFCLSGNHIACPVFQAANPMPMPPAFVGDTAESEQPNRRSSWLLLAAVGIPALITSAVLAVNSLNNRNLIPGKLNSSIPNSGANSNTPNSWSLLTTPKNTLELTTPLPSDEKISVTCPQPVGWTPYVVAPTDSLYRLSVIYGVSVSQLQKMNCMGNKTTILPRQLIYVPDLPTNTPEVSSTATPIPTALKNIPVSQSDSGSGSGDQKPADPTNPPPADKPTSVPPSNTPKPPSKTPVPPSKTPLPPSTRTPEPPATRTPVPPTATSKPHATKTQRPPDATAKPPVHKPPDAKPKPPETKPTQKPPKVKPTDPGKKKDKGGNGKDKGKDKKDKGKDKGKGGDDKGKDKGKGGDDKGKGKKKG